MSSTALTEEDRTKLQGALLGLPVEWDGSKLTVKAVDGEAIITVSFPDEVPTAIEEVRRILMAHRVKELWQSNKGSEKYRARQYATFKDYNSEPQDWQWDGTVDELRTVTGIPTGTCDLCGHRPIAYKFWLILTEPKNPRRGAKLGIGSECITNYHLATPGAEATFRKKVQQIRRIRAVCNRLMEDYGFTLPEAHRAIELSRAPMRVQQGKLMLQMKAKPSDHKPSWIEASRAAVAAIKKLVLGTKEAKA